MHIQSAQHSGKAGNYGFTIIEILIVVGIIGILASIAIPSYTEYVIRAKLTEASATLAGHRVKMEQYYQDNRTYTGACAAGTVAPLPTGEHFVYTCNITGGGQSYTVDATGNASSAMTGFVLRIDQSNNRTTQGVPAAWTLPSPNTCWIRKKNGTC